MWQIAGVAITLQKQNVADSAGMNELDGALAPGIVPELEARLKNSLGALGRRHHQLDIFRRDGHRLLAIHAGTDFERVDRNHFVRVHRSGDERDVDILALVQHLAEIGVGGGLIAGGIADGGLAFSRRSASRSQSATILTPATFSIFFRS